MSKTLDGIWGSDRNLLEKLARTAYAVIGKGGEPVNPEVARIIYQQANPDIDQNQDGRYGISGELGERPQPVSPVASTTKSSAPLTQTSTNTASSTNTAATSNTAATALAAEQARQRQRAGEAQGIKDRMVGRKGEFGTVLDDILRNIDTTYREESGRRKETYDSNSAELMRVLEQALPEIAASFAAVGGYDSSLRGYREMDAEKEHQSSQGELTREYETDLGNLGNKANQARAGARTSYQNFMTDFDTLAGTEANSDNLENIRRSENSLLKGLNEFRSQGDIYKPNSSFAREMSELGGDYNFGNIKDAFTSFLNTTGNVGRFNADENIATEAKKQTDKSKTELEQNKPIGVSK